MRVHRDALFALGFNFSFFTHLIETPAGERYQYCYEYGIRVDSDDFAELRVNNEFLEYSQG